MPFLFVIINSKHIFVNWLLINVKYYMYKKQNYKQTKISLNEIAINLFIKDNIQIEKYIYYKNSLL